MIKKFILIGMIIITLSSCAPVENKANTEKISASDTLELLESSSEIKIDKALISFKASYNVSCGDKKIGTITGKYANITGDKFTFKNVDGEILSSEKQIKRWGVKFNRLAEIYDKDDNIVGYIGEEKIQDFFKYGYRFHFYDKDKNEIAYTKDILFSLLSKYEVCNLEDKLICTIDAQFSINNQYKISIEEGNHIPKDQLIYFTCIIDSIKTSDDEKAKKKN